MMFRRLTELFHSRPYGEHLLRAALALTLIYPPLSALSEPYAWLGYFPSWITTLTPIEPLVLLHLFGAFEIALAVWLLTARDPRIPAGITGILLLAIVVVNPSQFLVLFRDVALALAAFALIPLAHPPLPKTDR